MPTGYTAYIENGKINNGKDFIKLCTRAFGIAIDLKDESLLIPTPIKFEPDKSYKERYDKAKKEYEYIKNISYEEALIKMKVEYNEEIESYNRCLKRATENNKKYEKIKKEIENWNIPNNEYINLKNFALEQINMSMMSEKTINEFKKGTEKKFDDSKEAVEKYIDESIKYSYEQLQRCKQKYLDNLDYTKEKNKWITTLFDSLDKDL